MEILFWFSAALLFYVYIGYPLITAGLARFKPREEYAISELPAVTLIIAAYNEEAVLEKKLQNTAELNYPPEKLQVIVAADGSSDATAAIVEAFTQRKVLLSYSKERRGKVAAVARAAKSAAGEIIVLSDANNLYPAYALKSLVQPFTDTRVGAASGAKHVEKEGDSLSASEGLYWKYESWIKRNESRLHTCTAAAGEILAVRRELFPQFPADVVNDDFYILLHVLRSGFRVVYVPAAESWERVSQSAEDEVKRRARISAGRFQAVSRSLGWLPWNDPLAVWQIISHKYLRLAIPFAMLAVLIANISLAFFNPQERDWALWLLAAQIVFYLLAVLGRKFNLKGFGKALYLPAFLVDSNLATLRGFFRQVRKGQDAAWEKAKRRS